MDGPQLHPCCHKCHHFFQFKSQEQSVRFPTFIMHSVIDEKVVDMYPEIELLDHMVILFCFFNVTSITLFMMSVLICNPTINTWRKVPSSPHLFSFKKLSWQVWGDVSLEFNFHFNNYQSYWVCSPLCLGHLYVSFGDMSSHSLCSVLKWAVFSPLGLILCVLQY